MPARQKPPLVLVYNDRVYFRDATGELWRVYDIVLGPDERANEHRFPLMPPDNRATYREFVSRAKVRRRYKYRTDERRGGELSVHQLTRQLAHSEVVGKP